MSSAGSGPRAAVPISNARAEASRKNGARSRGPKTPEGKARSSQNALKHGMRAQKYLVLPEEHGAEFHALEAALMGELAPVGALQSVLARRVAVAAWRLARADRIEADLFAERRYADDGLGLALIRDGNGTRSFETLLRYRGAAMAEFWRALRTLKALQAEQAVPLEQAAATTLALEAPATKPAALAPGAPLTARSCHPALLQPNGWERPGNREPAMEHAPRTNPSRAARCTKLRRAGALPNLPRKGIQRNPRPAGFRGNPQGMRRRTIPNAGGPGVFLATERYGDCHGRLAGTVRLPRLPFPTSLPRVQSEGGGNMAKCAFIGLGIMGYPMAGHLQARGHDVCVYNRTAQKAEAWARQYGGRTAPTPRQVAQGAEFVFMCVGNDDDIRSVAYGEDGALAGLGADRVLVDHTTASADIARELEAAAKDQGKHFIDAPVSGGQAGAENGTLTIMCGGEPAAFERAKPVMEAYGRAVTLMGPAGAGQLTKMVNQICIAGLVQGLAEGINFGMRAGLDMPKVIEVISKGAAQSWQMENRAGTMIQGKYDFGFPVMWMRKDLKICMEEANRNGALLPTTALIDQLYHQVMKAGGSRWDTSSLIHNLRLLD